jgi:hypothetical protein
MHYTSSVVSWLIRQSDWQGSLNPLRSLDGAWHKQIASVLENQLLNGQLQDGSTVLIDVPDATPANQIQFKITQH